MNRLFKIFPLKNYLTKDEKIVADILKKIPNEGMFNQVIINVANENKTDQVRMLFQMIHEQGEKNHERMIEIIGIEAFAAVESLYGNKIFY